MLEPPRVAHLTLQPGHADVRPGEQVAFVCSAADQYDQPIPLRTVAWNATGGAISPDGVFTAGQTPGQLLVRAAAEGCETTAHVHVLGLDAEEADEEEGVDISIGPRLLKWSGTIPTQKWTTFYMKVLTRLATAPGLKITVTLEVPVDGEQAQAKLDETRSGLKEVGVSDNVSLT